MFPFFWGGGRGFGKEKGGKRRRRRRVELTSSLSFFPLCVFRTERTYVKGLHQLVELYVKPSEAPFNGIGSKETVVPFAERRVVFSGLEGLLKFHQDSFLPKLEAAASPLLNPNLDDQDGTLSRAVAADVGDVFRTYNPFMRMYSTYIK